jgi:hypothetical protein
MQKNNNKVNYYDCFQLMHLKSGNFLEYKRNNKDLKTYIQLSSGMSKRTLFRFIPSFEYQTENSTNVFFYLSVQIASGEKRHNKEKYICSHKRKKENQASNQQKSIMDSLVNGEENEEEDNLISNTRPKKSIFDGKDLKII